MLINHIFMLQFRVKTDHIFMLHFRVKTDHIFMLHFRVKTDHIFMLHFRVKTNVGFSCGPIVNALPYFILSCRAYLTPSF